MKAESLFFRIAWIIIYSSSLIFCLYFIIENILSYFNYDSVVNVETKIEQPMEFPAITICNYYQIFKNISELRLNQLHKLYDNISNNSDINIKDLESNKWK